MSQDNGQGKWSGRSLASRGKHRFFYVLLRYVGLKPAKVILFFVVLFYSLCPGVYRRGQPYLKRRFGRSSILRGYWHTLRLYWNFGQVLLERAAGGILGNIDIISDEKDTAQLNEFLHEGRGVILLNAHVGFWQISFAGLDEGTRLNIFYRRAAGDVDKHYFEHNGASKSPDMHFIHAEKSSLSSIALASAIVRGEIVCMVGDRVLPGEKLQVRCKFLGGEIIVPGLPYMVASITGAPVMVALVHRTGPVRGRNVVYRIIKVPPRLPRDEAALRPYAQMFADALEEYAREHPYQFFNIFDMWTN